jgi:hypothetical protein
MKLFADLHCHPTMHQYAYDKSERKRKNNLWCDNPPKERQRKSAYPEYFQSSMPALARGNVKLIVAALYPLEQSWVSPELIGSGVFTDIVASKIVSHLPIKYINEVQSPSFNYFEALKNEYAFLKEDSHKPFKFEGKDWCYAVARNGNEVKELLNKENTIVIVPSVEGAHSLFSGNAIELIDNKKTAHDMLRNITEIKKWNHPPLYITLAHHFYNGLSGHTRSIPDGVASLLLDQQVGLNEPVNAAGEQVIDCLLGINEYENNGPRILIDTKHMSIAARIWYYQKITKYNQGRPKKERIPIVASHMGYGSHPTMLASITTPDTYSKKYKESTLFNPWSINLSDEEIGIIAHSNGLIGLNLDQRILSGNKVIEQADDFSKSDIKHNRHNVVEFWGNQFALNLLGIIKAIVNNNTLAKSIKSRAWDFVSLGTDFDGMINPIDSCIVSDEFIKLRDVLEEKLPEMEDFESFNQGLSVQNILDKVMYENVYRFVINNYNN